MEIRRILCPVDFSDLSALALRYAALLARCGGAKLTVAYASSFSPPPYFTGSSLVDLERQFRETFAEADQALRAFTATQLGPEAGAAEMKTVEGLPADGIRRLSAETNADLIVMGTHGRSGVNRFMLGSVAERVLRESDIPVLTMRGDIQEPVAPPARILCPINDTKAARAALSAAASLARCFGSEVVALHVAEGGSGTADSGLCGAVTEEMRAHCTIREVTRHGDPSTEIVSLAKETPCDLLVIGARRRRFFDTTVLGSTTARVVRHVPCPVLTVISREN